MNEISPAVNKLYKNTPTKDEMAEYFLFYEI